MWWLSGSTPDFRGRGLGFESGISQKDPGVYICRIIVYSTDGTGKGFLASVNPLVKVIPGTFSRGRDR